MQLSGFAILSAISCLTRAATQFVPKFVPQVHPLPFCNRSSWYIDHPCKADLTDHCCDPQCTYCGPREYCLKHCRLGRDSGVCNPRPQYGGPRLCQNYYQPCGESVHTGWAPPNTGAWVDGRGDDMHPRCMGHGPIHSRQRSFENCARSLCRASGWAEGRVKSIFPYVGAGPEQFYSLVDMSSQAETEATGEFGVRWNARITAQCSSQIREPVNLTHSVMIRDDLHVGWHAPTGHRMMPGDCCRVLISVFGKMKVNCGGSGLWVPTRLLTPCTHSMGGYRKTTTLYPPWKRYSTPPHGWQRYYSTTLEAGDPYYHPWENPNHRPWDTTPRNAHNWGTTPVDHLGESDSSESILNNLGKYVEENPEVMDEAKNAAGLAWHNVQGWLLAPTSPLQTTSSPADTVAAAAEPGWSTAAFIFLVVLTVLLAAACTGVAVAALSYRFLIHHSARNPALNASLLSAEAPKEDAGHEMEEARRPAASSSSSSRGAAAPPPEHEVAAHQGAEVQGLTSLPA